MAKTALRRHSTEKLRKKWSDYLKHNSMGCSPKSLSFGRIYSQDPLDCGNPRCLVCSLDKLLFSKKERVLKRKEEREALQEIENFE